MRQWSLRLGSMLLGAVLLVGVLPRASAQELTPGRYLAGENGEQDLESLVEISADGRITVTRLGQSSPRPPIQLTLEDLGSGHFRAMSADRDEALHLLIQTPDRILGWEEGDDDFGVLRRIEGTAPEALLGDWEGIDPDGGGREFQITIEPERIQLVTQSERVEGPLWVIATEGPTYQLAFARRAGGEPQLFHFHPLPEGGFLNWLEGGDDFMVLQRPGQWPDWLATPSGGSGPFVAPPPAK